MGKKEIKADIPKIQKNSEKKIVINKNNLVNPPNKHNKNSFGRLFGAPKNLKNPNPQVKKVNRKEENKIKKKESLEEKKSEENSEEKKKKLDITKKQNQKESKDNKINKKRNDENKKI